VPGERTLRRLLEAINVEELKEVLVAWMAQEEPQPTKVIHLDGKVIKNADPAPAVEKPPKVESEIPQEEQKPKADKALTLVNFVTSQQRLIDQIAVPANTNEEAAVAVHWQKMDLAGLKGNQPLAYAKAQQLLTGSFSPSGSDHRQRPRAD
jgi:hypothetical protein